jgi:hypothetical protein
MTNLSGGKFGNMLTQVDVVLPKREWLQMADAVCCISARRARMQAFAQLVTLSEKTHLPTFRP